MKSVIFIKEISKEYEDVPYQKILKYLFLLLFQNYTYIQIIYVQYIYVYTHIHQIKVCLLCNQRGIIR